jgi:hypothetical protein
LRSVGIQFLMDRDDAPLTLEDVLRWALAIAACNRRETPRRNVYQGRVTTVTNSDDIHRNDKYNLRVLFLFCYKLTYPSGRMTWAMFAFLINSVSVLGGHV